MMFLRSIVTKRLRHLLTAALALGVLSSAMVSTTAARVCGRGMYCPKYKITLYAFRRHVTAGCGSFWIESTITGEGHGQERTCMRGEPQGNIVVFYPNGDVNWGSYSAPVATSETR